jgi:hypothetical protein
MRYLSEEYTTLDAAFVARGIVRSTYEETGRSTYEASKNDKTESWGWRKFTRRTGVASNSLLVVSLGGRVVGFCGKQAEVLEALMAAKGATVTAANGDSSAIASLQRAGVPVFSAGTTARLLGPPLTVIAKRRYGQRTPLRPADYASVMRKDIAR